MLYLVFLTSSPIPESRSWREPFWWWESSSKRKVGSVACLATKEFVKPLASFSMIHVFCNLRKPMLCKQKQSRKKVNGCSFPATFSALTNQVSLFAVELSSHVDQRIEVWKRGGGFVVNLLTRKNLLCKHLFRCLWGWIWGLIIPITLQLQDINTWWR